MSVPAPLRLPVTHPDFRYPESRNPYWSKLQELGNHVFSDHGTEKNRGSWRNAFPDQITARELHVELGCNAGHVVVEWAARNPKAAYIGVDWKYKPIFRAAEKAMNRRIENLLFFRAHSERLPYMFGPGEVDFLNLFFPDPWPRKKQWKNRFVTPESLTNAAKVVKKDGIYHIKTDHDGYFEWMEAAVREVTALWEIVEHTRDLHAGHPAPLQLTIPEVTLFERLFIRDGINIKSIKLKRK